MSVFTNKISVNFIDANTGQIFMTSSIPIDQLPDTFEIDTTMHIGQNEWSIESADPNKKDDFRKTKNLTLILRKVEMVALQELLYSLPTICNYFGEVNEGLSKNDQVLEIMEDEWRNIEFILNSYSEDIDEMLEGIQQIHSEHRVEVGWNEIYVRRKIEFPFDKADIKIAVMFDAFSDNQLYSGVSYTNSQGEIENGFAFKTKGGITFYGRTAKSKLRELCVYEIVPTDAIERDIDSLEKFCIENNLSIVDWCRVFHALPNTKEFRLYFMNNALTRESR